MTCKTMKLLGSTVEKITKDKNGENVPHLENIEVVLVHCKMSITDSTMTHGSCLHLFQVNHLVSY